jgi:hypothetical protein
MAKHDSTQGFPVPRDPREPHKPSHLQTPEQALRALAYRRAGTAVAWVLFDLTPESVSLAERPKLLKRVDNRKTAERYALAELAGWAAQSRLNPRDQPWNEEGARECERLLRPWANSYPELAAYVQRFRIQARKLVENPVFWAKITCVAGELLSTVRLEGASLVEICRAVEDTLR